MLTVTLRDLQWRARRFLIAGLGAALVFGLALVLSGLDASFSQEAARVVDGVGADAWLVQPGVEGVFTAPSLVPQDLVAAVRAEPGVQRADPVVIVHASARAGAVKDVSVIGFAPGGLGTPRLASGRLPSSDREVVADRSLGSTVGATIVLAGQPLTVVGETQGMTALAGQPLLFDRMADARHLFLRDLPVVSAVLTRGVPRRVPVGLALRTAAQTRQDLLRPIRGAIASIRVSRLLLWVIAAIVVASVVYLSALERRQDFAVYKATGWSTRSLAGGLALQAVLLSTTASLLGLALAQLLLPLFPLNFTVPLSARLLLPVVGLLAGCVASLLGLRKAVGVEPALAFGGP